MIAQHDPRAGTTHRWRPEPHRGQAATPLPVGFRRCAGDCGCPFRIPVWREETLCPWHAQLEAFGGSMPAVRELMGSGAPSRAIGARALGGLSRAPLSARDRVAQSVSAAAGFDG